MAIAKEVRPIPKVPIFDSLFFQLVKWRGYLVLHRKKGKEIKVEYVYLLIPNWQRD
jgi:hypothetical protein